ncbi:MAG TPA: TraR/DksA C4-type zinc finger protein, partial [Chitinophagaceae bacterium]|nr:TraR/DksA C4-type zinc finger protein [Chitinophagaceae bacterium]
PKPVAKTPAKPAAKAPAKAPAAKAPAKPVAKAPAKPVAKVSSKPVAKAPAAKTPVKAPVKAAAKKETVVSKAPLKKATPAPASKAAAKPVAKAPAKPEVKKAVPAKPEAKKPVAKATAPATKPIPAKVEKKTPEAKAPVAKPKAKAEAPAKEKVAKARPEGKSKKAPVKTVITSTLPSMPKKSDVYKTNTFASPTLRNDSNRVIAHRKTSELKRKSENQVDVKQYEPLTRSLLDNTQGNDGPSFRYSDDDLQEFRDIILRKLDTAKAELQYLQSVIMRKDDGGTEDTENKYQNVEDGGASMEREQFNQLASRQITFINHLEQALVRIENKTYGICRETGKLIDKARLRAVPHATLSIEAKNAKKN